MAIRYNKCELAFESPRIFLWSSRHKLLLIAALAHALLLSLLTTSHAELRSWLFHLIPFSLIYEIREGSCFSRFCFVS
jgi:hypothetical protein